MEQLVAQLKKALPLKETTIVGDIVIIAAKTPQILSFGVITAIEKDEGRKEEWWHVSMQFLSIPLQEITWTLRTPQFSGQEIFTMGGEGRFIQAVDIDKKVDLLTSVSPQVREKSAKKGLRLIK